MEICWDKYINKEEKLKFRNLKENLTFGSFRPIILVVGGEEESRDKGRERNPILRGRRGRGGGGDEFRMY